MKTGRRKEEGEEVNGGWGSGWKLGGRARGKMYVSKFLLEGR